jgi:hypothetical protein
MFSSPRWLLFVSVLLILAERSVQAAAPVLDAKALSSRIDEVIQARLAKDGVPAAPLADDPEFFRRLSLDLNGRIPSLVQLLDFLDDNRPDKRRLWIDELLDGPDNAPLYVQRFTSVWRRQLLAFTPRQPAAVVAPLEGWLRKQVKANTSYDRLMRGLLTDAEAVGFYQANENKPENLAGRTSRLLLGVKLECAQCHDDRSGGKWKRAQFWEYAAFFTGLTEDRPRTDAIVALAPLDQKAGPARIRIGETDTWVEARLPDGSKPDWQRGVTPRTALAEWITRADNPWFARAAVNRLWHLFFGVGLIDPVDGLGSEGNLPSHPELLDELVRQFIAHEFDVKYLIQAFTGSQTYQRTSRQTHPGQADPRRFARAAVRGLTPEQLYDSVILASGYRPGPAVAASGPYAADTPRNEFLAPFDDATPEPIEVQASIQQALVMMNSKFIEDVTSPQRSTTLAAVQGGKASKPMARRIEELYLVTFSRKPRPEETERLVRFAETGDRKEALRDIFWSLLNSTEFVLNH